MRTSTLATAIAICAVAWFAVVSTVSAAAITADAVYGQRDFIHDALNNLDGRGIYPAAVAIDRSTTPNAIYVSDIGNNRVLGWPSVAALSSGEPAYLVIGQPDMSTSGIGLFDKPGSIAVDPQGNLYVADILHNRVLEFDRPFARGVASIVQADRVFGQHGSFTSFACGSGLSREPPVTADSLCAPSSVAVDPQGNLYIADFARVLEYNTPLQTTAVAGSGDTTADMVFGQNGDFTTDACDAGTMAGDVDGIGPDSLCVVQGLAVDSLGNLYVVDGLNRVLEYNTPLAKTAVAGSGDTIADTVFGQHGSFTTDICAGDAPNNVSPDAQTLCGPRGAAIDDAGNLYIADGIDRILEYDTPLEVTSTSGSGDTTADMVFGTGGSFTVHGTPGSGAGPGTLGNPVALAVDSSGNLYAVDQGNSRVLEYPDPAATGSTNAVLALGQVDLAHNGFDFPWAGGFDEPAGVAIDSENHMYVADTVNSRVLGFRDATSLQDGEPDIVIGQSDFYDATCPRSPQTGNPIASATDLCTPTGVAVDANGNLYVADGLNNRVLEYDAPFKKCSSFPCVLGAASRVFGQPDFTSNQCDNGRAAGDVDGVGPDALCDPEGVAVDPGGNLYVVDADNNRVLEYNQPLAPADPGSGAGDSLADHVLGQTTMTARDCAAEGGLYGSEPISAAGLCSPLAVAADSSGDIYVSDSANSRVLEYVQPLAPADSATGAGDAIADRVWGQNGSFTSNQCYSPIGEIAPYTAGTLCDPGYLALDAAGDLFIADAARVLEFDRPAGAPTNLMPSRVFGQPDFTSDTPVGGPEPATAQGMYQAGGVALDSIGDLFVADRVDNRVLKYDQPLAPAAPILSVTPSALTFSPESFDGPLPTFTQWQQVTVSNNGNAAAEISSVAAGAGFLTRNGCSTLAPNQSCQILVALPNLGACTPGKLTIVAGSGERIVNLECGPGVPAPQAATLGEMPLSLILQSAAPDSAPLATLSVSNAD